MVQLMVLLVSQVLASSSGVLTTELKDQTFRATVKEGFHFNDKAPNSILVDGQKIQPTKLTARETEFAGLPKSWSQGKASLYICDDAVTFCEPHYIELNGALASSQGLVTSKISNTGDNVKGTAYLKGKVNKHGFIEDDFNKALELAKKQKKLVLIDFSARWCPGCLRLENETFDTKLFKALTKDFVKLKIDVDRFENIVLSDKFKIKGIPTLLVVNEGQEEVDRFYDYQPPETLERFFNAIKSDPATINELKVKGGNPLRLGQRLLSSGRYQESVDVLSKVQPTPPELVQAQIELAAFQYKNDPKAKDQYVKILREALKAESDSSRSIGWRISLVDLVDDKDEKKKIAESGMKAADAMLTDKEKLKSGVKNDLVGEFTGYEPFLVAMNKADLAEAAELGEPTVSQTWTQAADVAKKLNISPRKIGVALRYLLILTKAKEYGEADRLALDILKHDPQNGDVMRRRLKVLLEQKRFKEAVTLGEKCLKNSYGRNEFWVAESLAKAYVGAEKPKEAKIILDKYLARPDIEWSNLKASRKGMEGLRKSL
jgi:thioredoxin-like negative regulator of GroEL